MLLRWIYYGVSLMLAAPFIAWHAIVSLIMYDITHWDNACEGILSSLRNNKQHFLSTKNKF